MNINEMIKSMTLEEKASLCSGKDFWHLNNIERLNIPSIMMADGPHGLRKEIERKNAGMNKSAPATCFPTAVTTASSWDRELMKNIGITLAEECLQEGVSVILGPGVNIKRSPLCGRNFEYISEDPYLTGELASAMIDGIQSRGVGTSLKHYAANNQEKRRLSISSVIDERALREIYLAGFEAAVKNSRPWTVMAAYNKLNNTYCCENTRLLKNILRDEWGFEGIVVSDWGACNDRAEGLLAGLDLEMPTSNGYNIRIIIEAIRNGQLEEAVLDKTVERLLKLIFKAEENKKPGFKYDVDAHHALAKRAAAESIVLLKNEDDILPLNSCRKIAVVGEFAKKPRYQGAGSSLINPLKLENIYDELVKREISHTYARGYDISDDEPDKVLIAEACEAAKEAETVLVFAGLTEKYEAEGYDRQHMRMPEAHNKLIESIASVNKNIVVVLSGGSPVEMPWIDKVKGVINSYLAGEAGASAVIDILYGIENPSGKLAETYPMKLSDNPSYNYYGKGDVTAEYRESIYVGYRYYDTADREVLFPFGYGLSYTNFNYSDITISKDNISDTDVLTVSARVKNTGAKAGAEIVQLYIRDTEATIFRPDKELKGFCKLFLKPGEEKAVEFVLNKRSFAYFNINTNDWHVEEGSFEILVGASSRDIRLKTAVYVKPAHTDTATPDYRSMAPSYYNLKAKGMEISDDEYKAVYGNVLPPSTLPRQREYTIHSTLEDISSTLIGKLMMNIARQQIKKMCETDNENDPTYNMYWHMIMETPLRGLALMNGIISMDMMYSIVKFANKKYFRGLGTLISSLFKKNKY